MPKIRPESIRKILRERGNPYWSLQLGDDEGQEVFTEKGRAYVRALENPYASLAVFGEADRPAAANLPSVFQGMSSRGISKATFQKGCREIFVQYIPPLENGRLRKHHQQFISRNENAAPARRELLLSKLKRYDLSTTPGLRPQFNRERDQLTERKLRALEEEVDQELK